MGAKFGNFSISDISFEETVKLLESYHKYSSSINYLELGKKLLAKDHQPPIDGQNKLLESLEKLSKIASSTFYVKTRGRWTTVYNEDFFVGTEINIMPLSLKCDNTFVVSEMFDGDVFGLAVIRKGLLLTRLASGATDSWHMTAKKGDLDILADTFGIPDKKKVLAVVLDCEDISDQVDALEELFDITLWSVGIEEGTESGWKKVVINPKEKNKKGVSKRKQVTVDQSSSPLSMAWEEFASTPPWKYGVKVKWETEINQASVVHEGRSALAREQDLIFAYNHVEDAHGVKKKGRLAKIINGTVTDYFEINEPITATMFGDNGDVFIISTKRYLDTEKEQHIDTTLSRIKPDGVIVWQYRFEDASISSFTIDVNSIFVYDFKSIIR